jgi:hypothetical protein
MTDREKLDATRRRAVALMTNIHILESSTQRIKIEEVLTDTKSLIETIRLSLEEVANYTVDHKDSVLAVVSNSLFKNLLALSETFEYTREEVGQCLYYATYNVLTRILQSHITNIDNAIRELEVLKDRVALLKELTVDRS